MRHCCSPQGDLPLQYKTYNQKHSTSNVIVFASSCQSLYPTAALADNDWDHIYTIAILQGYGGAGKIDPFKRQQELKAYRPQMHVQPSTHNTKEGGPLYCIVHCACLCFSVAPFVLLQCGSGCVLQAALSKPMLGAARDEHHQHTSFQLGAALLQSQCEWQLQYKP